MHALDTPGEYLFTQSIQHQLDSRACHSNHVILNQDQLATCMHEEEHICDEDLQQVHHNLTLNSQKTEQQNHVKNFIDATKIKFY